MSFQLTMALRRRTAAEQRVVQLLRLAAACVQAGMPLDLAGTKLRIPEGAVEDFLDLVRLAAARGYMIQPPGSPYAGSEELRLVGLLAQAQRTHVHNAVPLDKALQEAVGRCARVLNTGGLYLPAIAMVSAQLPEPPTRPD